MTRARETSRLVNSETFSVDSNNNVGLSSVTPDAKFDVVGVLSATSFSGDGSQLTGIIAGATLSASSGTQRLVVTSQTTGDMLDVATNSDLTYDTDTSTLSATQYSGTLLGDVTGLQGTPSITVQDITAEQISVAGTISYGSIDNENSVGVITANKGIKVPDGGVVVTGVITATSYQGDGSGLSGIELGTQSFVASGTIPNGATVVINTDGTVSAASSTIVSNIPSTGSEVVFNAAETRYISAVYDPDEQKVIVAYTDYGSSENGKVIVGTVSGNSISFGNEIEFNNQDTSHISCAYDTTNNKLVIAYTNNGASNTFHGTAIVGTVSGNSISFGTASEFLTSRSLDTSCVFDSSQSKFVITYGDFSNSIRGTAVVGTVSGTSISFGSPVVFFSTGTSYGKSAFDSTNNKVVTTFQDNANSSRGTAVVGTVSGTSISFGTPVVFNNANTNKADPVYDPVNEKIVIAYRDLGNSSYGTAIVGTVSGTSISFGTPVVFNNASTDESTCAYNSTDEKIVISYSDNTNNKLKTIIGTVSGTSISFGTSVDFNDSIANFISSAYDPVNNKVVTCYKDNGNSSYGTSVAISTISLLNNLTAENYIGIAAETISNGATGKITVVSGTNSSQTGLTTARKYYVQQGGTLGLTADTPSVVAGTSVSSTKIVIQKS
jgi:hypothetical protein